MKRTVLRLGLWAMIHLVIVIAAHGQSIRLYPTMGPYGGNVTGATVAPNGYIYVSSKGNGVFRSTDDGNSWIRLGLVGVSIGAIASDSNGTIYAGSSNAQSFYRSSNLGATWEPVIFDQRSIGAITVDTGNSIIAAAFGGVFHSDVDGSTWSWVSIAPGVDLKAATVDRGSIYVAGGQQVFRSDDRGKTWTQLTLLPSDLEGIRAISVDGTGTIYVGSAGVYKSTDGGKNWIRTTIAGRINVLLTARDGSQLAGTDSYGMFRSTDQGETWTHIGISAVSILSIAQNRTGTIFAGSREFGALRTDKTFDTMTIASSGLTCTSINQITADPDGILRVATSAGIFTSSTGGYPWKSAGLERINVTNVASSADGTVLVGSSDISSNGGTYRLESSGTWKQIGLWSNSVNKLAVNSHGEFLAATGPFSYPKGSFSISKSTDGGTSWNSFIPTDWMITSSISAITIGANDDVYLLVYGIIRSNDGGLTWNSLPGPNQLANALCITSSGVMFAGSIQDGIFRSPDEGETWQRVGLIGKTVSAIVANGRGWIFAGADDGLYLSTDGGGTWDLLETGESKAAVTSLALDADGVLYAASTDGGIYRSVESTTGVPSTGTSPSRSTLARIAPNPTKDRLNVRLSLPSAGFTSVELLDPTGARCARVFQGIAEAGEDNISYDVSELPCGTYFLRVTTEDLSAVEPLIIAR